MTKEEWSWEKGLLPHWAKAYNDGNPMRVGAHLPTRDGRRCGNAVVVCVEISDWDHRLRAKCVTDAGNMVTFSRDILEEWFHPSEWIHSSNSIRQKLRIGRESLD